jgi:hypothetical protein
MTRCQLNSTTSNINLMPNVLQLAFLLSTVSTFTFLLLLLSFSASYLNIRSIFLVPISYSQSSTATMDTILNNVRSLTESSSTFATAGIVLLSAFVLLYMNLKSFGQYNIVH